MCHRSNYSQIIRSDHRKIKQTLISKMGRNISHGKLSEGIKGGEIKVVRQHRFWCEVYALPDIQLGRFVAIR